MHVRTEDLCRRGRRIAIAGALLWGLGVLLLRPEPIALLFLVGPLVAVPLGFPLAVSSGASAAAGRRWFRVQRIQLPAAGLLLVSYAVEPGAAAAGLALPWVGVTVLVAFLGVLRLLERGPGPFAEAVVDLALVFLAVGGTWLLFSRAGLPFLGFEEPIVLLTAAHFHFAGFALTLVCGLLARRFPGAVPKAAAAGVVTGVPLVAAGITLAAAGSRWLELVAAFWLTASSFLVAALLFRFAAGSGDPVPRFFAGVAGGALTGAMALAALYAWGNAFGNPRIDIPSMVASHAALNVFGFALPALLAGHTARTAEDSRSRGSRGGISLLVTALDDPPPAGDWSRRRVPAAVGAGPGTCDPRDEHVRAIGVEEPGKPAPGGPFARAAEAIRRFDIFPPGRVRPLALRAPVTGGDTIISVSPVVPGLRVLLGARVVATFDGADGDGVRRAGFTYRTLEGHPLEGEETFAVEKDLRTGRVSVAIRSWSRPASFWVRILRPWVRHLQNRAAAGALERLASLAGARTPAGARRLDGR